MATKSSVLASPSPEAPSTASDAPEALASVVGKSVAEAAHIDVLQVGDFIENRMGRVLREFNLTLSQYQILRILQHASSALPALEVSQRMTQLAPAITGLLTRLEEQGLIKRKADKEDKRVTLVELTPKGRTLLKKIEKPVLDLHKGLAGDLNETELKQLSKLLQRAWQGMQTHCP